MAEQSRRVAWIPVVVLAVLLALVLVALNGIRDTLTTATEQGLPELIAPSSEIDRSGAVIVESVRSLSELSTVEVIQSTTVEKGEDRGWLDWAAGDRVFLFAVAGISAGVDLSDVQEGDVTIDQEANAIELRLPAPSITSIEVDNEQTRVYDRDTGLFTQGNADLERSARLAAEELMVGAALENGLLDDAEKTTEDALTQFLTATGFHDVEITFDEPDDSRG